MDKEGIMIYLCMKGQNEWLEEVKAYFQKSSDVLKVIEIDDWQNELSLTNQKGKILLEKIKQIQLKNKYLKCYISGYSLAGLFSLYSLHELDLDGLSVYLGLYGKKGG